jgi:hypothetical protein
VQRTLANVKAPDVNTDASRVLTDRSVSVKRAVSPMGRIALVRFLFCNSNLKCVLNLIFSVVKMRTSVPWKALAINYVPIPMDLSVANVLVDTRKTASVVMQSMV